MKRRILLAGPVLLATVLLSLLCGRAKFYGVVREGIANQKDLTELSEKVLTETPEWSGNWIWNESNDNDVFLRFRRTVLLTEADFAEPITAFVAADSRYWLYLNGQIVVREGGEKRGMKPDSTYYDTLNLTNYLREGENTIAVLVWYFGPDEQNLSYVSSGRASFYFQMETAAQTIVSDECWKTYQQIAYSNVGSEANLRLAEKDLTCYGKYLDHWTDPAYDDSFWEDAICCGRAGDEPQGELVPRQIPLFADYGLTDYGNAAEYTGRRLKKSKAQDGAGPSYEELTLTLPANIQFYPYLEIQSGRAGEEIEIFTDEYEDANGNSLKCRYVTKRGLQAFESPVWLNGQIVTYRVPCGIKIRALKYRRTGYDTEVTGSFTANDDFYGALWEKAKNTLLVNMHDTYLDCPNRERAQWFFDLALEMTEAAYALSDSADDLYRAGIRTTLGFAKDDGGLLSIVPASAPQAEMPLQMLAGISSYWDFYCKTGDRSFLKEIYEPTMKYLASWTVAEDGELRFSREALVWEWGDSTEDVDYPLLQAAWYIKATSDMARIAAVLEKTGDSAELARKRERVMDWLDGFWDGENGYFSGTTEEPDERVQAIAVLAGAAGPEKYGTIAEIFRKQYHATPPLEYYVESACVVIGETELAQERMKRCYAPMVSGEDARSTLWEYWTYGQGTSNHAWSGGPLVLMSRDFAGIQFLAPGADADLRIAPSLGELTEIFCEAPCRSGKVTVSLKRENEQLTLTLTQPADCVSIVDLPEYGYSGRITEPETTLVLHKD